ncbi:hypothetical protein V8F33_013832 [Rhypophila sp. PSN 637]
MSEKFRFVTDSHRPVNARRIPDQAWERHKEAILRLYQDHTVDEVRSLMQERYNINVTNRQLTHRLVDKWGVKKYNKKSTDDDGPHSTGPSSPQHRRSRSNTPLIDSSELDSLAERLIQPTVENVEGDGCPKTSAASSNRETAATQPAVPSATSPAGGIHVLRVTSLPPDEIPQFSRAITSVPVTRSAFQTQGPSRPPVHIIDSGIRAASRDMDDGQNIHQARLSCPYRKRNPLRFNVRDYHSCASQPYPDISQLKRHVKVFHKQRPVERCPRCKKGFGTKEEVERHLVVPSNQICDVKALPPPDPEDGINDAIEDCLNGRKANTKIDSWESLWHLLFPGDTPPADAGYYQVREHFELEQYLLQQTPDSENELKLRLLHMFESFNLSDPPNAGTSSYQNQEAAVRLRSLTPGPSIMPAPKAPVALMTPGPREPDPSIIVSPLTGIGTKQNKSKRRRVDDSASGGSTGIKET